MSKQQQTSLDRYLKAKGIESNNRQKFELPNKQKSSIRKHDSSREGSGTQVMESQQQIQFCPQFIMISSSDVVFKSSIRNKIVNLHKQYKPEEALKLIENNAKFSQKSKNIQNLETIADDLFWKKTFPSLLKIWIENSKDISACIQTLPSGSSKIVKITKKQILLIVIQMFLCIMPKQSFNDKVNFAQWMCIEDQEKASSNISSKIATRRQKLKCIINYFKTMVQRTQMFDKEVTIQRAYQNSGTGVQHQRENIFRQVHFQYIEKTIIQQFYGKAAMVDFANKGLGGGVLSNGSVQQQILFVTFPELLVTKIICQQLQDEEAIIIYGAQRFSFYSGYKDTFKFEGPYVLPSGDQYKKSIIIAIDALDWSKITNMQFTSKYILRQYNKALVGFAAIQHQVEQQIPICTGKWGCGIFQGDQLLKFLIQWIVCSEQNRNMIYVTDQTMTKQLKAMTDFFIEHGRTTGQVMSSLCDFWKFKKSTCQEITLIEYLQEFT